MPAEPQLWVAAVPGFVSVSLASTNPELPVVPGTATPGVQGSGARGC